MYENSGIYQIVNINNQKSYVGQTMNFNRRWRDHKCKLNNKKHSNKHLKSAWSLYGRNSFNFIILENVEPTKEKLTEREQYWMDTLSPEYNICPAAGSTLGIKATPEHILKNAETHKGLKPSKEVRARLSERQKGVKNHNFGKRCSEESNKRRSLLERGEQNSQAKLTEIQARKIRFELLPQKKLTQKEIANIFGVSEGAIADIYKNRSWKHII